MARPIKNLYPALPPLTPELQKALEFLRSLGESKTKKAVKINADARALGAYCRSASTDTTTLSDIDLGLYLLDGLARRGVLVVNGIPDKLARIPVRLLSESSVRIAAFRRKQRALGRKQVELWLSEEEKFAVLNLVSQMRGET